MGRERLALFNQSSHEAPCFVGQFTGIHVQINVVVGVHASNRKIMVLLSELLNKDRW